MATSDIPLQNLLEEVRSCERCEDLPLGPRPVVRAASTASVLIIGQAPGTRVHASGIPWDDPSGERLRNWMGLTSEQFYDTSRIAIMPMGFCYPGKGRSGDLPPRPECAPLWHEAILESLPNLGLTLLIGQYAQSYYLADHHRNLTERVKRWRDYLPRFLPLVHPSPRNRRWLAQNPWFEKELVPFLRMEVARRIS
ncbi:uracil-DNA glycosylase family protein [Porticoccus litoralis]|uniref:Uracil-DNA glycosylase family protein n=1 Tax=Porticoccus litoralis TaxID=434086 RepID=A0AAW8B472_9GAMM|nr:uracil-DNA glycosylase family protein [Porticoccus litoralis]MDP1521250.1 uracil-DNA glycosylase family protein [Porticoccus litoralis]